MSGRRLTGVDISAARHETEVMNSRLKRGEVPNADKIVETRHIVCGCGVEGCIFISCRREDKPKMPSTPT